MKCPKCQFENPEDSKFCFECGHKFELKCPNCDKDLPINVKFCNECGHDLRKPSETPLKDLSFDEKLTKIQKYLPKGLSEKILSQKDRIEGERKQVTVMFCDMQGFTPLSEMLGIEEAYAIIDQVYEILIHKVHDYEGTVNEMTGDGILALFGAPMALEEAPQRAIRSSLAIHRAIAKFSDKLKQGKKDCLPVKMRIGIHTGPVVVGTVGNDLRVEFKAVGDTVNMASRVEGIAEPGTSYVTEETFKLTEGLFRFEAIGNKQVKGKQQPINVYRVIAASARRSRFDVSAERGLTPFVGRERELELLIEGFERSKSGRGQAFSIVSEAGVGKSRLLYEFRKAVSHEDVTFLEGKCLSYSKGVAYHPVIDILKANFNIDETDGDLEITEKIKRALTALDIDEPSTLPYLLELLSVKESGIDKILISPEAKKDRIIDAINRIALKGSENRLLIMAFEDLHWIDKSSEESLKYLLDCITGARVFLIFTYRPDFVHSWGGRSYHSQVTLNRLSNHESLSMVTHLLDIEEIERDLEELILEKTEGIPFFIEEFTRSLKDLQVIKRKDKKYCLAKDIQDVAIPSTIQDVIMARVDSLPEGAKTLIQTGSVIEREFSFELIKRVTRTPQNELLSQLSALKDSELLYERGIYPKSTYIFKHALTREVVYDSILTNRQKRLHAKIGDAIEKLYKNNIDYYYGVLSEHNISCENYEKAADYAKLACERARKKSAFSDAISYARQSLFCLERLPKSTDIQKKIIDSRTTLANYLLNISQHVEAKEAVSPIMELAVQLNYREKLPRIYAVMGTYYHWVEEDFPKGFQFLRDALKISEEVGDYLSLYFASFYLGWGLAWNCEFEKSLSSFKRCLDLSIASNNLIGISFVKGISSAINYAFQGKMGLSYETSNEVLKSAKESGDIFIKGMAFSCYGVSCYFKGLLKEAENSLLKGAEFSEKTSQIGWWGWACLSLGHTYTDLGEYEKAQDYIAKCIKTIDSVKIVKSWGYLAHLLLTKVKLLSKGQNINPSEIYKYYENNKYKLIEGWIARFIGEILMSFDDEHVSEAENWIQKAIEANNTNGIIGLLGHDYMLYAELHKRKSNYPKAKENQNKAMEIFRECGADGWVEKYQKDLIEL